MVETECGSSTPSSNSKNTTTAHGGGGGGAATKYLANLPSRGLFSSTVLSSNPGGMRVYICERDTSPPEDQVIQTDRMNILIRSLILKKDGKNTSAGENSRKRAAERALDGRTSAKKAASSSQAASLRDGTKREFQSMTVERLRALLKEKGLSTRGKKDELITRLKGSSE